MSSSCSHPSPDEGAPLKECLLRRSLPTALGHGPHEIVGSRTSRQDREPLPSRRCEGTVAGFKMISFSSRPIPGAGPRSIP